ncbi:MAG: hypothetical protein V4671_02310 [Armatimonadota bacterium]
MPCDYSKYPADWKERRVRILERAKHRCEKCGVPNHAVGYRDADKRFVPNAGNGPCDAAGQGLSWPDYKPLTYGEAQEFVEHHNDCYQGKRRVDADGNHWFIIVLTVAHLDRTGAPGPEDGPFDCPDDRLQALCQACHIKLDTKRHVAKAKQGRMDSRAVGSLLEVAHASS